jgi:hypothetical protein
MPIEAKVEEAVKNNNGVIPMEEWHLKYSGKDSYIKTKDGTIIDFEQLRLLFWNYAKEDMSAEALHHYMTDKTITALDYAVYGNFAKAFWYRDNARELKTILEGRKFCDTLAKDILVNPNVRIAMANKLRDDAMDIYRKLNSRLSEFITDSFALTTPET